jgi:hypothetical protein
MNVAHLRVDKEIVQTIRESIRWHPLDISGSWSLFCEKTRGKFIKNL